MKKLYLILLPIAFCLSTTHAQEKPDSTFLKYHLNEFKQMQEQLKNLETAKVEMTGVLKYHYSRIMEEEKKLKIINDKKKMIK